MNRNLTKPCKKCKAVDRLPSDGRCRPCNQGLGHFRDDIKRLLAAITYLENTDG